MSGLGKDVSGVVRISWDEVRAGTFPDIVLHMYVPILKVALSPVVEVLVSLLLCLDVVGSFPTLLL